MQECRRKVGERAFPPIPWHLGAYKRTLSHEIQIQPGTVARLAFRSASILRRLKPMPNRHAALDQVEARPSSGSV
jgi:hypothetical protein